MSVGDLFPTHGLAVQIKIDIRLPDERDRQRTEFGANPCKTTRKKLVPPSRLA